MCIEDVFGYFHFDFVSFIWKEMFSTQKENFSITECDYDRMCVVCVSECVCVSSGVFVWQKWGKIVLCFRVLNGVFPSFSFCECTPKRVTWQIMRHHRQNDTMCHHQSSTGRQKQNKHANVMNFRAANRLCHHHHHRRHHTIQTHVTRHSYKPESECDYFYYDYISHCEL